MGVLSMAYSRTYRLPDDVTVETIGDKIEKYLINEKGLSVEKAPQINGYRIKAYEPSTIKEYAGLGQSLEVIIFSNSSQEVTVDIEMRPWKDRVGNMLLSFTRVTAIWGAIEQTKFPNELFSFIENNVINVPKS